MVTIGKNSILHAVYYLIAKDEKKKIKNNVKYDLISLNTLISPILENSWKGYTLKC